MHPEVKNIGFLMWLCAGITFLPIWVSFKYSYLINKLIKVIVTMLKQISQSAGNFIYFNDESTSETLRDKSVIKKISVHVPTHLKPITDQNFGYYLAGLIDGLGHFSKKQLVLVFNELDASLAYYIKAKIGYGNVYKVKNKKAVILVVSKQAGLNKVLDLINGKIRSQNKLDQIKNNVLLNLKAYTFSQVSVNTDISLQNHWLAGFTDADAIFQIKLISSVTNQKTEVRLNFQIDQKKNDLLNLIKKNLGGHISYAKTYDGFDLYTYNSFSLGSARKIINYFDRYHLLSHKHIYYLKWRKTYCRLMANNDLDNLSVNKITKVIKSFGSIRKFSTGIISINYLNPCLSGISDGDTSLTVKFKKKK
jgi:hypothetical protein